MPEVEKYREDYEVKESTERRSEFTSEKARAEDENGKAGLLASALAIELFLDYFEDPATTEVIDDRTRDEMGGGLAALDIEASRLSVNLWFATDYGDRFTALGYSGGGK